ncbi:galactose mutarotase, partial [Prochlorococcus sp. AH-716-D22]|nr:galactose mutarotase [Prochlorococcus sp. AH-716-D22]
MCGNLDIPNSLFGENYTQFMQHGFARDLHWQYCLNDSEKSLCLFLNESQTTKKYYPFDFQLRIEITLNINCLELEITIKNKTDIPMPVNFGLHPY